MNYKITITKNTFIAFYTDTGAAIIFERCPAADTS
jgi:hypothetical protein